MFDGIKARGLEALRSGKYTLVREKLHGAGGGFCCLGVLCDLHRISQEKEVPGWVGLGYPIGPDPESDDNMAYLGERNYLPRAVMDWAGIAVEGCGGSGCDPNVALPDGSLHCLSALNDGEHSMQEGPMDFSEIADLIENMEEM